MNSETEGPLVTEYRLAEQTGDSPFEHPDRLAWFRGMDCTSRAQAAQYLLKTVPGDGIHPTWQTCDYTSIARVLLGGPAADGTSIDPKWYFPPADPAFLHYPAKILDIWKKCYDVSVVETDPGWIRIVTVPHNETNWPAEALPWKYDPQTFDCLSAHWVCQLLAFEILDGSGYFDFF